MQIYVAEGTQHTGPFDLDTIRAGLHAGRYQPDQLAWYDGAPGWEPISHLPGLEEFLPSPLSAGAAPVAIPLPHPPGIQPYVPPAAYGPRRRSPWLARAGIVVGMVIIVGGVFALRHGLRSDGAGNGEPARSVATPPVASGSPSLSPVAPAVAVSPAAPVAPAVLVVGTQHFAANRARYHGDLAAHFVAFSFDYPGNWTVVENVNGEFVEAHRYVRAPDGSNVAVESFVASGAHSRPGTALAANLPSAGSQLLEMAAAPLLSRFPDATKTVPRSGHYGRYPAQEQLITSLADPAENLPARFFRQVIVARPNNSGADGLCITVFGSGPGGNPDAASLGKTGGLRVIEQSFRFEP